MLSFSLIEENMVAAPDLRLGLFWVAFVIRALNQPYELSQKVPKGPEPKMPLTEKIAFKTKLLREHESRYQRTPSTITNLKQTNF